MILSRSTSSRISEERRISRPFFFSKAQVHRGASLGHPTLPSERLLSKCSKLLSLFGR
ncbi:MAG: hypothetical protein JWO73_733 [Candidatus Taylorbacteria bacterium]|nr:hypothetical protein [Candidatus Taylorbacteria bacterium]